MTAKVLSWIGIFVFVLLFFAGGQLLLDYGIGRSFKPVEYYLISGSIASFLFAGMRAGWIRGVFRDPRKLAELRERQARLAEGRERAIGLAKHQ